MRVVIDSSINIENYNGSVEQWCKDNLILDNPMYLTLKRLGKDDTIKRKRIPETIKNYVRKGNTIQIPFGCLYGIWNLIKNEEIKLDFNNNRDISIKNVKTPIELFDYQEKAVSAMVEAKGGVLVSPCGSGKSYMGIEIIHRLGKRFLWLTHTSDLLNQVYKDFKNLYPNIDIGLITDGKVDIGKDGCIATVQTLTNIDPKIYANEFDVVMADECAHVSGTYTQIKMFSKILNNIPARYKYGLTATPDRSDSLINTMYMFLGMSKKGEFEGTYKVDKSEIKTMIATHIKYDLFTKVDMNSPIYGTDGMFVYEELTPFLISNEKRNKIIIDNIIKCDKEGRKQIVLTNRKEHIKKIYDYLQEQNIKCTFVVGETKKKERDKILSSQTDEWNVLIATYSLLKEGINIKALDTLHLTVPQKDKALIVQCAGRIERFLAGKKQPLIYDYVDVTIPYCENAFKKRKSYIKNRY